MIKKILYFIPAIGYYSLIFFLSSKSFRVRVLASPFDKFIHFIEFSLLGFLLAFGLFKSMRLSLKTQTGLTFLCGSILGILDEVHQSFIPGRYADVLDALFDIGGISFGIFIYRIVLKKLRLKLKIFFL